MSFDDFVYTEGLSWKESQSALVGDCIPVPYLTVNQMFKSIDRRREEIETADKSIHMIFSNITFDTLLEFDEHRESLRTHLRITYVEAVDTLTVKIPTRKHEKAHKSLGSMLTKECVLMGMSLEELMPVGAATKTLLGSNGRVSKEADSSFVNTLARPNGTDRPTLVIEVGDSESFVRLKLDAKVWIECSDGKVNIVLCIMINKRNKGMRVLKFIPQDPRPNYPHTLEQFVVRPQMVADILVDCSTSPPQTQGAPLTLEFEKVFDRQPVPPNERDIVFISQDLEKLARAVFSG